MNGRFKNATETQKRSHLIRLGCDAKNINKLLGERAKKDKEG